MAIYFVSPTGSDGANGTSQVTAWQTITKVNATTFSPGDSVLFQGGQSFSGNIVITGVTGSSSLPITVDSYGAGVATIAAGNGAAVYFHNCSGIVCQNLTVTGGVVGTNTGSGIQIINDLAGNVVLNYIRLNNITASGFGGNLAQAGILIQGNNSLSGFNDIRVTNVNCNGNMNGMLIGAVAGQTGTGIVATNVYVGASVFHDNQGLAGTPNNCGNGCLLYECNNGLVERCLAYNNGAANNNVAGPSGIWTSQSNNVTIQYCESHHNTSNGGDGDGFDIDGGCTGCIIQYCYSHDNKSVGFLMFNYLLGAGVHQGNIIRYNVSENDGIGLGMGSSTSTQMGPNQFYNNAVYSSVGDVVSFAQIHGTLSGITFKNNILYSAAGHNLINNSSASTGWTFTKNLWFASGAFSIVDGGTFTSLASWGKDATGIQINPVLFKPGGGGTIGNANNLNTLSAYQPLASSPVLAAGTVISGNGGLDFYGNTIGSPPAIGASDVFIVPVGNFVQGATTPTGAGGITSTTATYAAPNAAGNFLLLDIAWGATTGTVSSVTDPTSGDTGGWINIGGTFRSGSGSRETWYLPNCHAANPGRTITINFSAAQAFSGAEVGEWRGVVISTPLDVAGTSASGTTGPATASVTTTFAPDLVMSFIRTDAGRNISSQPTGFVSEVQIGTSQEIADAVANATGTSSPSYGITGASGGWVAQAIAFKLQVVTVPNVVGLTQSAASTAISNAILGVGTVTVQSSLSVPSGKVISQSPASGLSVTAGSAVNLNVSSGAPQGAYSNPSPFNVGAGSLGVLTTDSLNQQYQIAK